MFLSMVIPCYNEAEQLNATFERLATLCQKELPQTVTETELIFVDDGSKDATWTTLSEAKAKWTCSLKSQVKLLSFSRNFGKEAAILAGLEHIAPESEAVILLDADLQHPPALIPELINKFIETEADIIDATKSDRGDETKLNRFFANSFYRFFRRQSNLDLENMADFKLLSRRVVDLLCSLKERERFFRAMAGWVGFKHVKVPFMVEDRTFGTSKWTFKSKVKLSRDAFLGYTHLPNSFSWLLALLAALLCGCELIFIIIKALLPRLHVDRIDGLIFLILACTAAVLTSNALNSTYLDSIHTESLQRPHYIIGASDLD